MRDRIFLRMVTLRGQTTLLKSMGQRVREVEFIFEETIPVCSEPRCLWMADNVECSVNTLTTELGLVASVK